MILVLIWTQAFAWSAVKINDLNVEKLAEANCGTLASAMTERVYNTNKEMKKEYYQTPVFDKKSDFEMMRYLKLLATESESFTATTPDSRRVTSMLKAFEILKQKRHRYVIDCLGLYRPSFKACFVRYQMANKDDADKCSREAVETSSELSFIKKYFLRLK